MGSIGAKTLPVEVEGLCRFRCILRTARQQRCNVHSGDYQADGPSQRKECNPNTFTKDIAALDTSRIVMASRGQ